jgi:hypothetical protein
MRDVMEWVPNDTEQDPFVSASGEFGSIFKVLAAPSQRMPKKGAIAGDPARCTLQDARLTRLPVADSQAIKDSSGRKDSAQACIVRFGWFAASFSSGSRRSRRVRRWHREGLWAGWNACWRIGAVREP